MRNNHKLSGVQYCLATSKTVMVYVDPTRDPFDCVVPEHLRLKSTVAFQLGNEMPVPIPDLKLNLMGISATLSFRGQPFLVKLPWDCVYAVMMEDGRGYVWDPPAGAIPAEPTKLAKVYSMAEYRLRKGVV